jgi:hypothetical protein
MQFKKISNERLLLTPFHSSRNLSSEHLAFDCEVRQGFVVDKVALGKILSPSTLLRFVPVSVIPQMLHAHVSFIYHHHYITLATESDVT